MAKGGYASAALLCVACACNMALADEGCEVLGELVRSSVFALATGSDGERPAAALHTVGRSGAVGSVVSGAQACGSTIEVVTRAFSDSLASLNLPVAWNRQPVDRADHCLSRDLRRCYPSQYPLSSSPGPNQLAFVRDTWNGVRNAVASHMPYGTESGLSEFTLDSLDSALARHLLTPAHEPLYPSFQRFGGGQVRR